MRIILKYVEIQKENSNFTFKWDNLIYVPIKYKYSKPMFSTVKLTYNVYHCVCFCDKIINYFITASRIIT